jgi:hypothetical protein
MTPETSMNPTSEPLKAPNEAATKHAEPLVESADGKRPGVSAIVDEHRAPHFKLVEALNRYFQIGCTNFTRHELLAYGGMNWSRVENCLRAWESRGLIQVLKPLAGTQDGEIIVKLLHPIEDSKHWN